MLNGAGDDAVGHARKGSRGVVLRVAEGCTRRGAVAGGVLLLKETARIVEAAELHRDAGANADEWCECAFVEGKGAFVAVDAGGGGEGGEVRGGSLEAHFDNVKGLACDCIVSEFLVYIVRAGV